MLRFFKSFFTKAKAPEPRAEAPYKIEPPAPLTPPVVDMSVFPNLTVDGHGDVHETKKPEPKAKKPAARKPAAQRKTPEAKPAVAAKKPRARKPSTK